MGVSVKRGVGARVGAGVGAGVGVGAGAGVSFFIYLFFLHASFFLSFNPNSDFWQFASAVYRCNISRYKENKINVVELIFSHRPKQSRHISVKTKTVEYKSCRFLF